MLGDAVSEMEDKWRGPAQLASVGIMEKLLEETEGHPKGRIYDLRNEYYWQTAQHRQQFKLGEEINAENGRGHYSMIVGGAWYAHQLLGFDRIAMAKSYLSKVKKAWPKLQEYNKENNNIYYYYALALGLNGDYNEMKHTLTAYKNKIGLKKDNTHIKKLRMIIKDHQDKGRIPKS